MQQIPQTFRNFIAQGSLANFWCYKRKQNKTITVRRNFTKYKSCSGPESSKSKQPTFCDDTTEFLVSPRNEAQKFHALLIDRAEEKRRSSSEGN